MSLGILLVSNCGLMPNASTICLIRSARKSINMSVSPSEKLVVNSYSVHLKTQNQLVKQIDGNYVYIYGINFQQEKLCFFPALPTSHLCP